MNNRKNGTINVLEDRLRAADERLLREPLIQDALKAYRMLENEGCDMDVAQGYIVRAVKHKSGNHGPRFYGPPTGQRISRQLRRTTQLLKKLAKRIEGLREIWGFKKHMMEADAYHVPEQLWSIAQRVSSISTKGFQEWHPQREALLDLLDLVRRSTGRYHYGEVSLLLNAEQIQRAVALRFDVDSLKMIVQRDRQRQMHGWKVIELPESTSRSEEPNYFA